MFKGGMVFNKLINSLILSLVLIGCQSSGVIPMSQNSYFIGKKDGSPGIGISFTNKAEVYQEANEFCNKKGLEVKTLRETVIASAPARLGSTELHFKCVKIGGEAEALKKDPDAVIEVNNN
jgi:hypothetical protein